MEGTVYCEARDCEVHAHVGPDTMEARRLPIGWVVVRFFEGNGGLVEHGFCEPNCALKWLAENTEPSEVIE
jgi:hypothetical protein